MRGLVKRWWFWTGICFLHVAIAVGYLLIPLNPPRISQANFDKIKAGWTSSQVTELLGYHSFSNGFRADVDAIWWDDDDDDRIEISFNESLVVAKQFIPTKLSAFEQMKRRIEKRIREPRCPRPSIGPSVSPVAPDPR